MIMDIAAVKEKTVSVLERIRESSAFKAVYELLTKRVLFFSLLLIFGIASYRSVLTALSTSDFLLYYALPQSPGEFRPNTLFGIMNFSFRDFDNISMILKCAYLVLLLLFTVFAYALIKRADGKGRKFEAFAGLVFILIITVTSSEDTYISNFSFNSMTALTLTVGAVLAAVSLKARYIPIVFILVFSAQMIDCRAVMLIIPISAVTAFTANIICKEPAKLRAMCITAICAAAAVFAVTQINAMNTVTDLDAVKEYIIGNQKDGMKLQYVDIQKWYTATPFTWFTFYIPVNFTAYGTFKLFINKNNFVLLSIAFSLAYIIKAARRPFSESGLPKSRLSELKQSLGSIFCINKGGSRGKVFVLFCLTAVMLLDIFAPDMLFFNYAIIVVCAAVVFFIEKGRFTLIDKIDKPTFFKISVILIISKYLTYTLIYSQLNDYDMVISYVSYQSFGLIPRGVYGSLLYAIFGYNLRPGTVIYVSTLLKVVLIAFLVFYLYRDIKRTKTKAERTVIGMLSFLFIVSPAFSFLFCIGNILKTADVLIMIAGVICIDIAARNRKLVWFVPILSALCMFIHPVYISMMFPAVFIILAYRAFVNDQGHIVRNSVVTVTAVIFTAAVFFYFMFVYASPEGITADDYMNVIYDRSHEQFLEHVLFDHTRVIITDIFITDSMQRIARWHYSITPAHIQNAIIYLLMSLPLLFGFIYMLKHSSSMEKKLLPKLGYLAMGLSMLVAILPFISDVDYGRWCGFVTAMIIFVMIKVTNMQPEDKKWYKDLPPDKLKHYLALTVILASLFPTLSDSLRAMYMLHI
ncbi:MAG: hypothetical protein IJT87_02820 [Ruminiclostridium sp.]|nr:hypothetical protein [Ruminiclostridium sp.]